MTDPDDFPFASFDLPVPTRPVPGAEIRRRGDRRRRRARIVGTTAAVVVLAAVVTPVAVLADRGFDGPDRPAPAGPSATDPTDPSDPTVTTPAPSRQDLPPAADLPAVPDDPNASDLTAWAQAPASVDPFARPATCVVGSGHVTPPQPELTAVYSAGPSSGQAGDQSFALASITVAEFDDEAGAQDAYAAAVTAISTCPEPDGPQRSRMHREAGQHELTVDGAESAWVAWSYPNADACGGGNCDAAIFDRMGVARLGDRIVYFSLQDDGGPLERRGMDDVMDGIRAAAIASARS